MALLSSVPLSSVPGIFLSSVSASVVVVSERDDSLASLSVASLTAFLLNDLTALSDSSVKSIGEQARLQFSTPPQLHFYKNANEYIFITNIPVALQLRDGRNFDVNERQKEAPALTALFIYTMYSDRVYVLL